MWLYVVIALVAVALGFVLWVAFRREHDEQQPPVEQVWTVARRACAEDLQRARADVAAFDPGPDLGEAHAHMVELLHEATSRLDDATGPTDLTAVTATLSRIRTGLSRMAAEIVGDPAPTRRPMCFFNPNHGISETTASWTTPDGARVRVPCCAADAHRLSEGADAYVRSIRLGSSRLPWWQVAECQPWAAGWFAEWSDHPVMAQLVRAAPLLGEAHEPTRLRRAS